MIGGDNNPKLPGVNNANNVTNKWLVTAPNLTGIGTVITGTWQATVLSGTYGGTGVNNGSKTLTYLKNISLTSADDTGVYTLPTGTQTLVPTSTDISSLGIVTKTNNVSFAASATIDTTVASNISSGTLPSARLVGLYTGVTGLAAQGQALNMNTNKINNVVDPTSAQDAATKNYVDTSLTGFQVIEQVQAATTTALVGTYNNGAGTFTLTGLGVLTIDGQTLVLNQRYLLKDQTNGFQNGVYTNTILGAIGIAAVFTRAIDYNTATEMDAGSLIPCINGTVNANKIFLQSANIVTVGTDNLVFGQFGLAGAALTANNLSDLASASTARTNLGLGTLAVLSDPLALNKGGSAASLTASNGGIIYSNATTMAVLGGTGTAGQVLLSGASTTPTWSTPTYPSSSGTSGKVLISDGTNNIYSTSTIPTSSGATANKVLLSDGTNYVLSTPTFPNTSATTRKMVVSDGTNWVASTETWAVPGTSGNVLKSDGTNWTSAAPAAGGSGFTVVGKQVLTGSGTYTATAGTTRIWARAVAGGGGGGGATSATGAVGAGGGAGAYGEYWGTDTSLAYVVGAVGTGGTAGNTGTTGGDTTLGTAAAKLNLKGGLGGTSIASAAGGTAGGVGGAATTAAFGIAGGHGTSAYTTNAVAMWPGIGASSPFGMGGSGTILASGAAAGSAGQGYGSGGGGAAVYNGSAAGGDGAAGTIVIIEFGT